MNSLGNATRCGGRTNRGDLDKPKRSRIRETAVNQLDNTLGCAATFFVFAALLVDLRHDIRRLISGRSVVLVAILCWYLLEAVKLSPVLENYSQATYNLSVFYVVVAATAFLVGYHLTSGCQYFRPLAQTVSVLDDRRVLWALVGFLAH